MPNQLAQEIDVSFDRLTQTLCPKCSRPSPDYDLDRFGQCEECYDSMSDCFISYTAIKHSLPLLTILDHIKEGE